MDRPETRRRLSSQGGISVAAAVILVGLALVIQFVPVPFAIWSPGSTTNLLGPIPESADESPIIEIRGAETYPSLGSVHLLTLSESRADTTISLPAALYAHWMPKTDALPQSWVHPPGKTQQQAEEEDRLDMNYSQRDAAVAALIAAGQPVERYPQVVTVVTTGPAADVLRPGDFIVAADGAAMATPQDVVKAIAAKKVNEKISFRIIRDEKKYDVEVKVVPSNTDDEAPVIGVEVADGYMHAAEIDYHVDPAIGGPSGGLMFALAAYERLSPRDVIGERSIAGTGTLTAQGVVGPIGGVQEKIGAAEKAGVSVFFLPAGNCPDLTGVTTDLRLVPVETLAQSIEALNALADPATADSVAECP